MSLSQFQLSECYKTSRQTVTSSCGCLNEEYDYDPRKECVLVVDVLGRRMSDTRLLSETFKKLGFRVTREKCVLDAEELIAVVEDVCAQNCDMFLCVILGDDGSDMDGNRGIVTLSGSTVDRDALVNAAASVDSMCGKPKVLIFDGDRKSVLQKNASQPFREANNGPLQPLVKGNKDIARPCDGNKAVRDTVVVHSTQPECASQQYEFGRSLYVKLLSECILNGCKRSEFLDVLRRVESQLNLISVEGTFSFYKLPDKGHSAYRVATAIAQKTAVNAKQQSVAVNPQSSVYLVYGLVKPLLLPAPETSTLKYVPR